MINKIYGFLAAFLMLNTICMDNVNNKQVTSKDDKYVISVPGDENLTEPIDIFNSSFSQIHLISNIISPDADKVLKAKLIKGFGTQLNEFIKPGFQSLLYKNTLNVNKKFTHKYKLLIFGQNGDIISANRDTVSIIDIKNGKKSHKIKLKSNKGDVKISYLESLDDGEIFAYSKSTNTFFIITTDNKFEEIDLGIDTQFDNIMISSSGRFVLLSIDANLCLISLGNGTPKPIEFEDHKSKISVLAISPDGNLIASGDADGNLVLKDVSDLDNIKTINLKKHTKEIQYISLAKNKMVSYEEGKLIVWDLETGAVKEFLIYNPLLSIKINKTGEYCCLLFKDSVVFVDLDSCGYNKISLSTSKSNKFILSKDEKSFLLKENGKWELGNLDNNWKINELTSGQLLFILKLCQKDNNLDLNNIFYKRILESFDSKKTKRLVKLLPKIVLFKEFIKDYIDKDSAKIVIKYLE